MGIFTGLLQYFPKNRAMLVQKLGEEKKLSTSVSSYLKTKKRKSSYGHLARGGGGKALMALPLREDIFFCGFPYSLERTTIHSFIHLFPLCLLYAPF